jgi:multiple sugar transport system substrate-binding protein
MKGRRILVSLSLVLVIVASLLAGCGTPATPEKEIVEVTRVVEVEKEVVVTQEVEVEKEVIVTKEVEVEKEVVVTATPAPLPEGAKTILRVGTGDSGEGLNPHQEIIAQFEAENPDILIQLEAVAGSDYYARLLTQIAAGDAPDIMQIGDDAVPMFVDKGGLTPLDDFINGEYPLDPGIYLPGTFEPGQYNGQQWCLPKDFSPMAVYYNKTLFDQYGVEYPTEGWTWDDLLEKAQALTDPDNGIWGIQLTANWTTGFEYWIGAAGGRLISEDGTTFVGYMDSPESIEAVQFFADLYNKYKVAPPPADFNLWAGGNAEFDNGKAAMRLFGRWPQAGYKTNPNIDLGVVTPPAGAQPADVLFWGGFCIFSGTENAEAAWRFLRFYVGEEGSQVWKDWAIPPVASVAAEAGLTDDPIEGAWIKGLDMLVDRAYVATPFWGETADPALRTALETVLIDPNADVAEVMKTAAQEAQAALDEKLSE